MPELLTEHTSFPLFGCTERAEQLVQWSMKNKPGTYWIKKFPFGLSLTFTASGETPSVKISWNNAIFSDFIKCLGFDPGKLFFTTFGLCVNYSRAYCRVSLPSVGRRRKIILWDSATEFCQENKNANVYWVIGKLELTQKGILFYTREETQREVVTSRPLGQISTGKVETHTSGGIKGEGWTISSPNRKENSCQQ